jgi:acyl-CoA dehydrogenase
VLAAGDADAQRDLLPVLAAGERRMTMASAETARTWLPPQPEVAAEQTGGAWVVTGTKRSVLDGADAHELLVLAATPSGPALFLVAADDARVSRSANPTMDRTRRLAEVQFDAAPGRLVGELGAGVDALRRAGQIASTMLACEQVGAAATVLDLMVEYAGVREQFGRPIGTFQAIKHSCAETMLQVESATSAARHAVHTINDSPAELAHWSSVALVYCSEAFSAATYRAVQLFGGIGFTWEHPIHLYLKRAAGARQLFGNPGQHRELLASELGLTTSEDATS